MADCTECKADLYDADGICKDCDGELCNEVVKKARAYLSKGSTLNRGELRKSLKVLDDKRGYDESELEVFDKPGLWLTRKFLPMHQWLADVGKGSLRIYHTTADEEEVERMKHQDRENGTHQYDTFVPGTYTVLFDEKAKSENPLRKEGAIIMSDTPMEQDTNRGFLHRAHGDVLIAGLGIGMLLRPLQDAPEVKSITVIETNQELIDLINMAGFAFDKKTKIICGDILKWKPPRGKSYDCIWFDIWNSIGGANYKDMAKLHGRFKLHLRTNGFMDSWEYKRCKHNEEVWQKFRAMRESPEKRRLANKMLAENIC